MQDDDGEPNASLQSITDAAMPNVQPTQQANQEKESLDYQHKQFESELGWLGRPFGGRKEKPGNLSGLVLILCFVGLALAYIRPPDAEAPFTFQDVFGGLTAIITLVLGYLFGSNDRS